MDPKYDYDRWGYTIRRGFLDPDRVADIAGELLTRVRIQLPYAGLEPGSEDADPVEALSSELQRLEAARPGAQAWIYDEVNRMPSIHALASDPELLGTVRGLLGPDIAIHPRLNMIMAMPGDEWHLAVWHQDGFYGPSNHLAAYLPLQASGAHNGGLCVAPGEHLRGALPHDERDWGIDTKFHTLDQACVQDFAEHRELELEAGDLLCFDRFLPHTARVNPSADVRFAITIRYVDLRDPEFAARGWRWQDRAEAGLGALAAPRPK